MNPNKNIVSSNTPRLSATGTRKRVSRFSDLQPGRMADDIKESMVNIPKRAKAKSNCTVPSASSAMVMGARAAQTKQVQPTAYKWKSSFKPIDQENPEDESQEQSSEESPETYDPFDPPMENLPNVNLWDISCDSPPKEDDDVGWQRSPPEQDGNLKWNRMSPDRSGRVTPLWMSDRALDVHDFSSKSRLSDVARPGHCRLSEQRSYSPDMKSMELLRYGCSRRSLSPDGRNDCSSSRRYSAFYGGETTKGEKESTRPNYRNPMIPRFRLSSPTLQRDYGIMEKPVEAELEYSSGMPRIKRQMRKSVQMDQITINCDLCDIEVSNGQELAKHLQSKIHWDTMEHIQEQSNYDDMTIAFLQDVMLYKSIKCSRAIDYNALQALQEKDHMTKVSLFHCSACQVLVSTAAVAVQNHITSPEHLSNTREFQAQQRPASLAKADTIIKQLQPQFEHFIKGFSQFE